eukprot:977017-Amphidinium_carterae.1
MNERAMEELDRNRRKPQAHLGDVVPPVPDAYGAEGRGRGRGGGDKGKERGRGGKDKGQGGQRPPNQYRNRDDNPADTRPICPDFLTDRGCPRGGQCTQRHPTK